jgi:hypothetical protein
MNLGIIVLPCLDMMIQERDVGGPLIVTSRGTPRTPIEGTSDASHVVTPVMQAALDPLMHSSTLNGP